MFEALIWFILPILMVVINDVMAYMFGFFFGKTPLIKLSPKKTWEGFIGGAVSWSKSEASVKKVCPQLTYFKDEPFSNSFSLFLSFLSVQLVGNMFLMLEFDMRFSGVGRDRSTD